MNREAVLDENLINKYVDNLIERDGHIDTIERIKRQLQFASALPNVDPLAIEFITRTLEVAQSRKPAGVFER